MLVNRHEAGLQKPTFKCIFDLHITKKKKMSRIIENSEKTLKYCTGVFLDEGVGKVVK